ncbi:MAG: carboxylesterase family protein, partial [Syntrophales bacterium]|nr:carboxylesterase family protein [Syntrophales bacterium]
YRGIHLVAVIVAGFMLRYVNGSPGGARAVAQDSMSLERHTAQGVVIGTADKATNTLSWKGIPYAKAPVDELRWKEPQDPEKRAEPLETSAFCEICPQYIDHDANRTTPQIVLGSEDCLYLNIWRPKSRDDKLPVYFWIHGGGNSIQWPLLSWLDGSILANRSDMVVVSVNYRLGPMGWFSHPALRTGEKGDERTDSGNFGTLDLIKALSWVQDNIKAFGGDPANVTIAGESAGGQNVITLIASPLAQGLFHRAISESGVIREKTPSQGEEHVNSVIKRFLVKDGTAPDEKVATAKLKGMSNEKIAQYLRSKSAKEFLETYPEGPSRGMIHFPSWFADGTVHPVDFYAAMKAGTYNKVPTILGTNKEEMKLFLMFDPSFAPWLKDGSLFKDPARGELYELVARYQTEGWKIMAVDGLARILRSHADQPGVYTYEFLWGAGGMKKSVMPRPYGLLMGSCHAMELDFVFGTEAASLGDYAFDRKNRPGRVALSSAMMDYWAQFARTGNPNREGSGLSEWKAWSNEQGSPKTILLDAGFDTVKIEMSNQELTEEASKKALEAEARAQELEPLVEASLLNR